MKIVHAADLHLDSPLRGLERYEGAPTERLRGATRAALHNLVELCLEERASLLLVAGDLFDGDWKDYATGLFFLSALAPLQEAQIPVVIIRGNHDATSQITRHLRWPEGIVQLGSRKAETRRFDNLGLAIHGQSFGKRDVREDLASSYPEPISGLFNIGLLHTALSGRPGHEPYAPCSLETLVNKGYDYWALGHVHQFEVAHRHPWVVFPGNLQGRHVRELGPRGAVLVELAAGVIQGVEHRPLDVVRWAHIELQLGAEDGPSQMLELARNRLEAEVDAAAGRLLAARISVRGACAAHAHLFRDPDRWESELRALATDVAFGQLWLERIRFETSPDYDSRQLARRNDAVGQIVRSLATLRDEPQALDELLRELEPLRAKLPSEIARDLAGFDLDEPAARAQVLDDLERLILPSLGTLVEEA